MTPPDTTLPWSAGSGRDVAISRLATCTLVRAPPEAASASAAAPATYGAAIEVPAG